MGDDRNPFAGWNTDLPIRVERRGEFPAHQDPPDGRRVLTREQAKREAAQRLAEWRRCHGGD